MNQKIPNNLIDLPISDLELLAKIKHKKIEEATKLTKYIDENPIEFFRPNPPQARLIEAWKKERYSIFLATGGNRFGKTALGAVLAISTMFGYLPWDGTKLHFIHNKPRKVRYICQDFEKLARTVVVPALEQWWPKNRKLKTKNNMLGIRAFWEDVVTGSTLEIMTSGQIRSSHAGWFGDLMIYDEPMERDVYIESARGLIDRKGRELLCMTLLNEHAWIDQEIIKGMNKDGTPKINVFHCTGTPFDNVGFGLKDNDSINTFIEKMGIHDDDINARIWGIPSYLSGLVYPQFNRDKHIISSSTPIHRNWILDIGIDVHPSKPQAVLFLVTSETNNKYVVDEIWENYDPETLAYKIVEKIYKLGCRVNRIVIDPLAKGDSNNIESTYDKIFRVLREYNFPLECGSKDVDGGILAVKTGLLGPNRIPSLFFFSDLKRTIYEIERFATKEGKIVKKDDDMMENLRRIMLLNTEWEEEYDPMFEQRQKQTPRSSLGIYV